MGRRVCRVCGGSDLKTYLDLGMMPLANACLRKKDLKKKEYKARLAVQFCEGCSLSQLTEVVPAERLYARYLYRSGTPRTFRDHCDGLAEDVKRRFPESKTMLDIASNDGTLLRSFRRVGMLVQGIDPAGNLVREANKNNLPTVCDFWPPRKPIGTFDVITSTNVVAHVDDVHGFVGGVKSHLNENGVWVLEVPYVGDLVKSMAFDTVYHEHLSYFTLAALKRLVEVHHGLKVLRVDHFPKVHGGTIRVWVSRDGTEDKSVGLFLDQEKRRGVLAFRCYRLFRDRVHRSREKVRRFLSGKRVWAYGAAAKGATLLNYYGITVKDVPVVIDDNSKKWGLYMPGSRVQIVGARELNNNASHLLLLAWNFKDEIMQRCRRLGYEGKFIVPVPAMKEVV